MNRDRDPLDRLRRANPVPTDEVPTPDSPLAQPLPDRGHVLAAAGLAVAAEIERQRAEAGLRHLGGERGPATLIAAIRMRDAGTLAAVEMADELHAVGGGDLHAFVRDGRRDDGKQERGDGDDPSHRRSSDGRR